MKIALIGATGFIGAYILTEALQRGHVVTAIVRNAEKLPAHANLYAEQGDVSNEEELAELLKGNEAVISAYNPLNSPANINGMQSIINAVKKAGIRRLLVVGGAGSLEVSPGIQYVDTPEFPAEWREGARATREALNIIKKESELEWSFVSPSALIEPGERTGKFRQGLDQLLRDEHGESRISTQDYAVTMLDELEHPKHIRQRFTVGY